MVDHQKRGSIAYGKLLDIIKTPEFGEIMNIEVKSHAFPYDSLFNCLLEWDIHAIDMMLAIGGDVKEITAKCKYLKSDPERASIAILVEFENGVVGTINLGTEGNSGCQAERVEVVGSNLRTVIVDNARRLIYTDENDLQVWESDWKPISENMTHVLDGYVRNIYNFCKSIHTRQTPLPSIYNEWQALKFIYDVAGQCGIEKKWKMVIGER
jgi:predicted dehydrogenase